MTIRSVLVELVIPKLDGTYAPATLNGKPGEILATPTRRHNATTPAGLVLPSAQVAKLDSVGQVTLHLEHNDPSWLWRIEEHVNRGRTRFVSIEDGDPEEVLLYRALPDVDPGSGNPEVATPPWWTALEEEEEAREAADALLTPLSDPRLTNSRPPNGGAGGVLSGSYPNPGFAVDMAEQTELNALAAALSAHADTEAAARTAAIAALVDSSPATLDTLNELAAALADDPNFATTMTTALGTKATTAALAAETAARTAEDIALDLDIAAEAVARASGDTTLAGLISDLAADLAALGPIPTPATYEALIARSVDDMNTAISITPGAYQALVPIIAVPPTDRPVMLAYGGGLIVTVAGPGACGIGVADITAGTLLKTSAAFRSGSMLAGTFSSLQSVHGLKALPPSTSWRRYRLIGFVFRDSGSMAVSTAASGTGSGTATAGDNQQFLEAWQL